MAKDHYTEGIFTQEEEDYERPFSQPFKKFWEYIKSLKKDASGVYSLKDDIVLVLDSKGKAEILNHQYASVFTEEDIDSDPDLGISPHPTMPAIIIQRAGVDKLLRNLQPNKAAGPDRRSPHCLKEVSKELSPLYTRLFQKSINEGYVPRECGAAHISPIFRKGATLPTIDQYLLHQLPAKS